VKICCDDMKEKMCYTGQNEEDKLVYYSSRFSEYGLPIYDGENGKATSYVLIQYCPWCGKRLPQSRRKEWFDSLEKLGFDSPFENFDHIPEKFKTDAWYVDYKKN